MYCGKLLNEIVSSRIHSQTLLSKVRFRILLANSGGSETTPNWGHHSHFPPKTKNCFLPLSIFFQKKNLKILLPGIMYNTYELNN